MTTNRFGLAALVLCFTASAAWAQAPEKPVDCPVTDSFQELRQCARERSWILGGLDESAAAYQSYLQARPEDRQAWLEYVQVMIWLGDYAGAQSALSQYRERFGEDDEFRSKRARLFARAEWPARAAGINDALLAQYPDDYNINYTHTLILRANHQPHAAIDSLQALQRLRPDSKDTVDIARFTHTPNRSHLRAALGYYYDSDDIDMRDLSVDGRFVLDNRHTALLAGYSDYRLSARSGSGLDTWDGHRGIGFNHTWVGVEQRWSPWLWTELLLGREAIDGGSDVDTQRLTLQLDPHDKLALQFRHEHALYDLSPRSVSDGVVQTANRIGINWRPGLRWTIDAQFNGADFSDDNESEQYIISPRRAILRREHIKLDLGVSGEWLAFDRDLNHGYYDPDWYRRYALTAFAYWKIDDDNGVSASLSLGWHQDDDMSSYKFGEDIAIEGYFGIFRDWYLIVRAGYVERYNSIGSYDGTVINASLMRRF